MRTKIIESESEGLWLKIIVAVLEDHEIKHASTLPYNQTHMPEVPLLRLERNTQPDDIWILDLSTREGAAFSTSDNPQRAMSRIMANL